jgi:alkyl hydroperoxide reductase subunit AhpF
MPTLVPDAIKAQVKEVFKSLSQPVRVVFFGSKTDCDYCPETLQLLQEVVALSDKLSLNTHDLIEDAGLAQRYHVDKAPGFVIAGLEIRPAGEQVVDFDVAGLETEPMQVVDYGVRYAGIPAGHEFTALINDIVQVSTRQSGLSEPTREFLRGLNQPVLLQVFSTPT